ncbi:hypothetical protein MN116_002387 [Schistosoma mekongi]|uniref:RCC1-like domain-containing protein n=1 Tax=Schistosoma mekongi TaxID=38744 RepID=A0AAE1ZK32_SCHME|nr:hypothetical protein MN116_002387 [Schistosoma mekongi]
MLTWGANSHGQLGTGDNNDTREPYKIDFNGPVTLIAGGGGHSLIVTENNIFSCGLNSVGQLGRSNDCSCFKLMPFSFSSTVRKVSCGWDFSVVVLNDGSVFSWGSNAYGQLGKENINSSIVPIHVDIEPIRSISAGLRHVIAVSISGKLFGWGSNRRKQLFADTSFIKTEYYDKSKEILYRPTLLNPELGSTNEYVDCAAGAYHSVVKTSTNKLALWGDIRFFKRVSVVQDSFSNIGVESSHPIWYNSELFGGNEIEQVVCGWSHVLVRTSVGEVYSWGRSDLGQLGRNIGVLNEIMKKSGEKFPDYEAHPGRVRFYVNTTHEATIRTVACGSEHSLAIDSSGQLWVWGWNEHGMCGVKAKIEGQSEREGNQAEFATYIREPYRVKLESSDSNCEVIYVGCGYGHSMAYVKFN